MILIYTPTVKKTRLRIKKCSGNLIPVFKDFFTTYRNKTAMKKMIWAIGIMGTLPVFGQDCQQFLFFQKGKTIEMTIYNNTGAINGKQVYQVSNVTSESDTTTSNLSSELFDKTGKSFAKSNSLVKCTGGVMMVDMKMMMPQQSRSPGNTEATIGNEFLEFPFNLFVGEKLKDGSFTMHVTMQSIQETVAISITDRKVVSQEPVTTSAGSWSCFKINSTNTVTVNMAGRTMPPMSTESISWYKPGFGIIKTQSANGSTAITSIK